VRFIVGKGEGANLNGVRMDKWLWAARFFKTRALAVKACELGRVQSNGQPAKAAREVRSGDRLQVRNEGGEFVVDVLALSDVRGPAAAAQELYRETEERKAERVRVADERKAMFGAEGPAAGRPSKRDRREIGRVRGRG
jgi:ribosome-associated heat shock protein Hsp15